MLYKLYNLELYLWKLIGKASFAFTKNEPTENWKKNTGVSMLISFICDDFQ